MGTFKVVPAASPWFGLLCLHQMSKQSCCAPGTVFIFEINET